MSPARDSVRANHERLASYVPNAVRCAWCSRHLSDGIEPYSDGICGPCEAKLLATIPHRNAIIDPNARPIVAYSMRRVYRTLRGYGATARNARWEARRVRHACAMASSHARLGAL